MLGTSGKVALVAWQVYTVLVFAGADSSCFGVCRCSEGISTISIRCKRLDLTEIPVFNDSTEYYKLDLSNNKITELPDSAFGQLRVREIEMKGNPLKSVSTEFLKGLEGYLEILAIEGGGETKISLDAMRRMERLEELHLINMQAFTELNVDELTSSLTRLYISKDLLTRVYGTNEALKVLDLSENQLKDLPELRSTSLSKLNIYNNKIAVTSNSSRFFINNPNVQVFDMSFCQVTSLPNEFLRHAKKLQFINLENNQLNEKVFSKLELVGESLKVLNLEKNFISNLSTSTLQSFAALSNLDLAGNGITRLLPNMFPKSLEILKLEGNKLESIAATAFDETSLTELYIGDQNLQNVLNSSRILEPLASSLTTLSIKSAKFNSKNFVSIEKLTNLVKLELFKNDITDISEDSIAGLRKLQKIELNDNKIKTLSAASLFGLSELSRLDLRNNNITTIEKCSFHNLNKLQEVLLSDNPLNCDCDLMWLLNWTRRSGDPRSSVGSNFGRWKCEQPPPLKNKLFSDLNQTDFADCPRSLGLDSSSCQAPPMSSTSLPVTATGSDASLTSSSSSTTQRSSTTHRGRPTTNYITATGSSFTIFSKLSTTPSAPQTSSTSDVLKANYSVISNSINISWEAAPSAGEEVKVTYAIKGSGTVVSETLPANAKSYSIKNLRPAVNYTVCVWIGSARKSCFDVSIEQPRSLEYANSNHVGTILGAVFGILGILIILAVIFVVRKRFFKRGSDKAKQEPDYLEPRRAPLGAENFMPMETRESRRFKRKSPSGAPTVNSVSQENKNNISNDEKERNLHRCSPDEQVNLPGGCSRDGACGVGIPQNRWTIASNTSIDPRYVSDPTEPGRSATDTEGYLSPNRILNASDAAVPVGRLDQASSSMDDHIYAEIPCNVPPVLPPRNSPRLMRQSEIGGVGQSVIGNGRESTWSNRTDDGNGRPTEVRESYI